MDSVLIYKEITVVIVFLINNLTQSHYINLSRYLSLLDNVLVGYFNIDKLRQLLDYIMSEDKVKGIFVGNSWRLEDPRNRDLDKGFTNEVISRAEKHGVCLVTVPLLCNAYLEATNDEEKSKITIRKNL